MRIERATPFNFGPGQELRTRSAEDLVVNEVVCLSPVDVRDAEGVAIRNRSRLDWRYIEEQLQPLAEVKQDPEILRMLARLRELGCESWKLAA